MRASFQGLPGSVRRNPANFLRKKADVSTHTDVTVPTQFIEADGIRDAYRRFGRTGAEVFSGESLL